MIVEGRTRLLRLFWRHRLAVLAAFVITFAVEVANDYLILSRPVFSYAFIGMLVTALSIFLAFRVNEAYARWWEARTLWGEIVNDSRSWSRQVAQFVVDVDARAPLVRRQIAFVHALRLRLRRQPLDGELGNFIAPDELEALERVPNLPMALLQRQAAELQALRQGGALDPIDQHRMESTLTSLTASQGGCERIKNTAFPDEVAYISRMTAWFLAIVIPVAVLDESNVPNVMEMLLVPLIMLAFILTERLGAALKNPFQNLPNDTPMTSICRTIEIDLLASINEAELPEPLAPENGVLM
jgi:putative membrane protein